MRKNPLITLLSVLLLIFLIGNVSAIIGYVGTNKIYITGHQGDIVEKNILVKNMNNYSIDISLSSSSSEILLNETNFNLNADEEKRFYWNTTLNRLGNYSETITTNFKAGTNEISLKTTLVFNVTQQSEINNTNSTINDTEASGGKIAYVVKTRTNSVIINSLDDLALDYEVIYESGLGNTNFSKYKVIIVDDATFSSPEKIPVSLTHSLILNSRYLNTWNIADSSDTLSSSQNLKGIIVYNNSINSGMASPVTLYSQRAINAYALPKIPSRAYGIKTVIGTDNTDKKPLVGIISPGDKLYDNSFSKKRLVYFGLTETGYWTAETTSLFKNSILWALNGEDLDGDGFLGDSDCNDNNALINPNGIEIPYNGLDENCDGIDLVDVDGDSFNASAVGGDDCKDNDASFHPGALDKTKDCVNDAPVLNENIPQVNWDEDSETTIDLRDYFSDPDEDDLTFSLKDSSSNEDIIVNLNNGIVNLRAIDNWSGTDWIIFRASDESLSGDTNTISLRVNPVNDNPILSFIQDILVLAGDIVNIHPHATDIDGDNITYSFTGNINSTGSWKTTGTDAEYTTLVTASDGNGGTDSQTVKIRVLSKIYINEFLPNGNSAEEFVELYNPDSSDLNLSLYSCEIRNSLGESSVARGLIKGRGFLSINLDNKLDDLGDKISLYCNSLAIDSVSYENYDDGTTEDNAPISDGKSTGRTPDGKDSGNDANDFRILNIPTPGLENNADMSPPSVSLFNPGNNQVFNTSRTVNFTFSSLDDQGKVDCSIYINLVNGNFAPVYSLTNLSNGNHTFTLDNIADGNYKWNVKCSDSRNSVFANGNKTFSIDAPDFPVIAYIGDRTVNENSLLEFSVSATDSDSAGNLTFSAINLPLGATFNLEEKKFSFTPNFNQSGSYSVTFVVKDETNLESRQTITISVLDVREPPKFSDIRTCSLNEINDSLTVDLRSPTENKKFQLGDEITIKLDVRNNLDNKMNVDIIASLYDITTEEEIENDKDSLDVSGNDKETVELKITVPEDLDENDEYVIFVKTSGEENGNNLCNQEYVQIMLERQTDRVDISSMIINPTVARPEDSVNINIRVNNIGTEEQEGVYVVLENSDLSLSMTSETFDLEEFGEDDENKILFTFTVPEDVEEKDYILKATVFYNGEQTELEKTLTVSSDTNNVIEDTNTDEIFNDNNDESNIETEGDNADSGIINLGLIHLNRYNPETIYLKTQTSNSIPSTNVIKLGKKVQDDRISSVLRSGETSEKEVSTSPQYSLLTLVNLILLVGIVLVIIGIVIYRRRHY